MPLEIGSLLNGRYRITGVLGQGGMGAVYLATDESLAVPCAVKENLTLSPETERLFRREAGLLASLRHPNLPRVTNHFVLGGEQYLVMDFVEGEDLKQRLDRDGPLPEGLVLRWAAQLCGAVAYLHGLNPPVVHRDIKPANIKLTPTGDIMLVDFGVARPTSADQRTATATMAFTPGFTPPEQYGLGRPDGRSDQYALAATFYTLLTGQTPPDSVEVLLGNSSVIPPERLTPGLSAETSAALMRGLQIKPEERFASVETFQAALMHSPLADDPGLTRLPPSRSAVAPADATMIARAAGSTRIGLGEPVSPPHFQPPTRQPARATILIDPAEAAPRVAPRRAGGPPRALIYGAGGCLVLVLAGWAVAGGMWFGTRLKGTPTPPPTATLAAVAPVFDTATPIAVVEASTATQAPNSNPSPISASETPEPSVTRVPAPSDTPAPAGTPLGSGGRLAFISNRDGQYFQIYTMNPDGSDVRQVTNDPVNKWDPQWTFNGTQLAWSPDGAQLLYVAENALGNGTDVWMIDADGSDLINLTSAAGDDYQPAWCSDGSIWFTSTRANNVPQIFYTSLERVGASQRPTNFSGTHNYQREYDPIPLAGCQRALFVTTLNGVGEIWRYFLDCAECYRLVRSDKDLGAAADEPALSVDGTYLAYTRRRANSNEIVVGQLNDRTVNVQLTDSLGNAQAQWSPDDQRLVFVSTRDGNREIYRMTLAGTSQTNLTNDPAIDTDPVWQAAPVP